MRIYQAENYKAMSRRAADILAAQIIQAAAHESRLGQTVKIKEFAHRIDNQEIRVLTRRRAFQHP